MDRIQKVNYLKDVETYLESHKVYSIFENLLKDLIISQPEKPIDYLINKIQEPKLKKVFLVGPPGSRTSELASQLANEYKFACISIGEILKKQISMKNIYGQEIEKSFQQLSYVKDDIIIQLVKQEIEQLESNKQNYFLEGFPKTRVQAIALQKAGIIPDTFIIINKDDNNIKKSCQEKICQNKDGFFSNQIIENKNKNSQNYALEYQFIQKQKNNIQQKQKHLMQFKINPKSPKRVAKIIVTGPPGSGRTKLSKNLAKKYGLVYISTTELISNQVNLKTEVGKVCMQIVSQGDCVPDEIINGLIDNRIKQTDCHLQGFVLDGFPKNIVQLLSLQDLQIVPTLIVELELSDDIVLQRFKEKKVDPESGIVYDRLNPTNDPQITKRLLQNPNEQNHIINKRLRIWKENQKHFHQHYNHLIFKTSGNLTPKNILEKVSFHLENYEN
ncbi:hypothetical protein IMG5_151980 [Ichthyophthirius multifiliis]|uniref:Adenylate kinase n=1 Tax=Ichthyophthirius multifiliis TaxID=5932 RepID=G0QYR2_ICHMU|nr:hypothetical protein IMG5_151980 [Ichthyophthirius multifiliis]EGR29649.1 hypothetical protein IMG5_151980 [Ichthyophthirius multifiliis]|eukprot:XP_004030885.1 hypothetical protein IMG5_151980 [Ichthyophthirius multifiliis]